MSKRTVMVLAGPWAVVTHIGLARVRGWIEASFLDRHPFLATLFSFLAMVLVGGISLALFRGKPKGWPWGEVLSIAGTATVSAVLLTASVTIEGLATSADTHPCTMSLVSFEVAFLSFFVVLMKAILVGERLPPKEDGSSLSPWQVLALAFREGQRKVRS
jgi:hypothetical protein